MKHLKRFNERIFGGKKTEELKPMSIRKTIPRPEQPIEKISDDQLELMKKDLEFSLNKREKRIDPYFIQEINDRILGPDSIEYIEEIKELNKKYRSRTSKTGTDIYKK